MCPMTSQVEQRAGAGAAHARRQAGVRLQLLVLRAAMPVAVRPDEELDAHDEEEADAAEEGAHGVGLARRPATHAAAPAFLHPRPQSATATAPNRGQVRNLNPTRPRRQTPPRGGKRALNNNRGAHLSRTPARRSEARGPRPLSRRRLVGECCAPRRCRCVFDLHALAVCAIHGFYVTRPITYRDGYKDGGSGGDERTRGGQGLRCVWPERGNESTHSTPSWCLKAELDAQSIGASPFLGFRLGTWGKQLACQAFKSQQPDPKDPSLLAMTHPLGHAKCTTTAATRAGALTCQGVGMSTSPRVTRKPDHPRNEHLSILDIAESFCVGCHAFGLERPM